MLSIIKFTTGCILVIWDVLVFFIRLIDGGDRRDDNASPVGAHHNLNTGDIDLVKRADSTYAGDNFLSPQDKGKRT